MAAQKGSEFLLKIDTTGSGNFATIGGFLAHTMVINNEIVDITTKGTDKWRELIEGAGIQSMTITGNGIFKDGANEEILRASAMAQTHVDYEMHSGNGDKFAGSFQVASYERSGDHNGAEMFAATFESAGTISFTGA